MSVCGNFTSNIEGSIDGYITSSIVADAMS
jgi:hypothetical protein